MTKVTTFPRAPRKSKPPRGRALLRSLGIEIGPAELADLLSRHRPITPQAISQWHRVPIDRAADVELVTGVSRKVLRPDIFGEAA